MSFQNHDRCTTSSSNSSDLNDPESIRSYTSSNLIHEFVYRKGHQLWIGNQDLKPFKIVGPNIYWLGMSTYFL